MGNINRAILISLASEAIILSSTVYADTTHSINSVEALGEAISQSKAKDFPVTPSSVLQQQADAEMFYKSPGQILHENRNLMASGDNNNDSNDINGISNQQDVVTPCYVESYTPCYSNHSDCGRGHY
ncbi:hypothetical protein [Cysteiniphilum litorale]|uniref:hypothetical protein n=1 Tax=Cysteiniphilum litorale TaxID=2056700 RepID=UPI003F884C40